MVEFKNQGDFKNIEYKDEILTVYDKYGEHLEFHRLPELIFKEFEEKRF